MQREKRKRWGGDNADPFSSATATTAPDRLGDTAMAVRAAVGRSWSALSAGGSILIVSVPSITVNGRPMILQAL
jgi:hypothetical protein